MKTRGIKREVSGTVISNKMDKTVVVQVERLVKHPMYKKYIRRRNKFRAHDKDNACQIGDRVTLIESRPLSKTKRWRLVRVVQPAVIK